MRASAASRLRPVAVAAVVVLLDQVVKAFVAHLLPAGASVTVLRGIVSVTHVQNRGVAFGWFSGVSPAITVLAALTLFFMLFYNRGRRPEPRAEAAGLALMAGGAAGNLLDRVRLGFVVDYLDLHVWPVFNLADVAIVVGAGVVALALARQGRVLQSRR